MSTESKCVDLFRLAGDYISRMIPEDDTMKVLLLDDETLANVSLSFSQTQLLKKGVFLVDRIDNASTRRGKMPTMRCCIFVRPSISSVRAVCEELKAARYSSYHVVFSNAVVNISTLDDLAKADVQNMVCSVEEYFCDIVVTNSDAFVIPLRHHALIPALMDRLHFQRVAEGLAATFVALRRKPHIRFQHRSPYVSRVVDELLQLLKGDPSLYSFNPKDSVLIINDRAEDPVTPLLTPWTYQAMLHELVGIRANRVRLPDTQKDEDEHCFSEHDDSFYADNMFKNWGDLCASVKDYVDKCKATLQMVDKTATMEEIKQFMQKLPQTKSLTGSVTKHATVVSHLGSIIKKRSLLDVSLLEQDMVSSSNASEHWTRLQEIANRHDIDAVDKLRLCLIYNLRYEKFNTESKTENLLTTTDERLTIRKLREYYGDRPTDNMFASTGVMSSIVKTFSDVGNIYTQHEPLLKKVLHALITGKLDSEQYMYAPVQPQPSAPFRPKEIVVFTCGGITYAEAALVRSINNATAYTAKGGSLTLTAAAAADVKVLIGGTAILNSAMFLQHLQDHP